MAQDGSATDPSEVRCLNQSVFLAPRLTIRGILVRTCAWRSHAVSLSPHGRHPSIQTPHAPTPRTHACMPPCHNAHATSMPAHRTAPTDACARGATQTCGMLCQCAPVAWLLRRRRTGTSGQLPESPSPSSSSSSVCQPPYVDSAPPQHLSASRVSIKTRRDTASACSGSAQPRLVRHPEGGGTAP